MKRNLLRYCFQPFIIFLIIACSGSDHDDKKPVINYIDLETNKLYKHIKSSDKLSLIGYFSKRDTINIKYIDDFNRSAGNLKDSVDFIFVDIDMHHSFAKGQNIKCVPSYRIIKKGDIISKFNGKLDSAEIINVITSVTDDAGTNFN